ncbi:hypothetical protein PVAP13_7NG105389 [Panicum virgatum]|uniref:Uncharacterized protein n=1 Tax=Panicum virgatum TaxID=38727 RepID=A0A8T0PS79_PANVG|nr:hypothetical protein PVAP13_7NG105389 [Panicum virgatum]KAG2564853.1 hypothetical protein PVAP13_7NG105389 [Panicum virgatum]KAG2564854.1 hypothetical protein PVAP13_7NG105389 [Panicum virgatum]
MYALYVRERANLKKLKLKVAKSLHHDLLLMTIRKAVIKKYGVGALLEFSKCYVPNKVAKWLARQVNWKSRDIVFKDKVIPLTVETVHFLGCLWVASLSLLITILERQTYWLSLTSHPCCKFISLLTS